MYCEQCGSVIGDASGTCGKCGKTVVQSDVPQQSVSPEPGTKSKGSSVTVLRISLAVLGVVLILSFFFPFYRYGGVSVSGLSVVTETSSYFSVVSNAGPETSGFASKVLRGTDNSVIISGAIGVIVLLTAPLVFALLGLLFLFGKGGRYAVVYGVFIFGLLMVMINRINEVTAEIGTTLDLASVTGIGFWFCVLASVAASGFSAVSVVRPAQK